MYLKKLKRMHRLRLENAKASVATNCEHFPKALLNTPDDHLALSIATRIIQDLTVKNVEASWATLSQEEKILITEDEICKIKGMPTDTIPELDKWRNEWIALMQSAKIGGAI